MSDRSFGFRTAPIVLSLLVLVAGCAPSPESAGQTAQPQADQGGQPAAAGTAATATMSHPDFTGVWMAFSVENPEGGGDAETAGPGAGNAPRYSDEGRAMLDAYVAQFREIPEPGANCVGTGMPGMMLSTVSYPVQLVQTDSLILMVAELETQVRRVFLDGRGHPDVAFPTGVGDSIGTWDGDTLVIDTALLEPWRIRPWPRSDEAHIVERVYLTKLDQIAARPSGFVGDLDAAINDDVLVFDITLTDPVYYDGPQRRIAYYQRVADTETSEYGCIKGLWEDQLDALRIR